ncbi:nitroreductase family protein [Rhodococcus sp. p52]|uniref:nitroreductase family protein n=1 Tax=Rhodococcus sp. p52 TaxID=935199 RepID=UPI0012F4CB7D|nr:nitroreductase family protein [Rhodococcus sp. p52]
MSLKKKLKSVDSLRQFVKRVKIHREYFYDARFMSSHLLDGGRESSHEQYRIMLRVHSLEKGMAYRSPRSFGAAKAVALAQMLENASIETRTSTAYRMGESVLRAWLEFHADRDDKNQDAYEAIERFLARAEEPEVEACEAGVRTISERDPDAWANLPFDEFVASRHSTRRYSSEDVADEVLDEAVQLAMLSPSACNRQMVRLHVIDDPEGKRLLYDTLHGTGGVDYDTCQMGLITYDSRSLEFYGERNQGYLNAGLFAMTLVYALHWKGVGACLLQFGNTAAEERALIRGLGIPEYERAAVGISFGHLEASDVVPASVRRGVVEVLRRNASSQIGNVL